MEHYGLPHLKALKGGQGGASLRGGHRGARLIDVAGVGGVPLPYGICVNADVPLEVVTLDYQEWLRSIWIG